MTEQVSQGFPLNSRFTLLPTPVVVPGKCAVCGAVDKPVVDFNMTIQFYGAILLCVDCMREAAQGLGMVDRTELIEAQAELAQSLETQLAQKNMRAVSDEFLFTLSGVLASVSDYVLPADNRGIDVVAAETGTTESEVFESTSSDDAGSAGDSDASESANNADVEGSVGDSKQDNNFIVSEGPDSVSASSGDGSPFNF